MPITQSDIKLFASLRMADATDGGGPMAGQPLQDGVENNVFPDISSTIDVARGALQLRAVYMAVLTATTDTLRQAHVILSDLPDATGVGSLLIKGSNAARDVATLVAELNAAGDDFVFCGATPTTDVVPIGQATVPVDGVRATLIPKAATQGPVSGLLTSTQALPTVVALVAADGAGATVPARMPRQELRVPVVPGQTVYTIAVPAGTLAGTESFVVPNAAGSGTSGGLANFGASDFVLFGGGVTFANIDRVNGQLQLVQTSPPSLGEIVVQFALDGSTTTLAAGDLAAGAFDAQGRVQVNLGAGHVLAGALLSVGGTTLRLFANVVYSGGTVYTAAGGVQFAPSGVVGSYTDAGLVTVPGRASQTITAFVGAKRSTAYPVSDIRVTLPQNIDPATLVVTGETSAGAAFTATASALGIFATAQVAGSYTAATGELVLVFTATSKAGSLAYTGTQLNPQASYADIWGLDESAFPGNGQVRVVRPGQVAVLRHTATVAAAHYAAGNTVNLGRTDVADVRVVGANGLGIATGWTLDAAAGLVNISSVAGWDLPATIEHAIEHVAMVVGVPDDATVALNRPVTRAFPSGSLLSTAVLLGDLQARVGAVFSQQAWGDVWADVRSGAAIAAQYQDAAYPIVVTNHGAATERWAFVFKTSTQFDLIGETVGRVASGDTATVFAPINPATAQPYMTVAPGGWGIWAAGNVLRVNTTGATGLVWPVRTVQPGATVAGRDQAVMAARGDIDQ